MKINVEQVVVELGTLEEAAPFSVVADKARDILIVVAMSPQDIMDMDIECLLAVSVVDGRIRTLRKSTRVVKLNACITIAA